ncbi:hypothetical protein [Paenibacillus hamazuiensis]|uniref:hypothetical protein n=1 Tax=Paenibacillus hamazuiensis TaxID=2936508 RepID=UPI00200DD7CE|nr:hypothetical protein [Paenibacillus hamazuiensis]
MTKPGIKLSMPVAFMIENCRASGISDDLLIESLLRRDFTAIRHAGDGDIDFAKLLDTAAEIGDDWENAIRYGYEFSFISINGLRKLLNFRFRKLEHQDYEVDGLIIRHLALTAEEVGELRGLISRQWAVNETGTDREQRTVVQVELKYQSMPKNQWVIG